MSDASCVSVVVAACRGEDRFPRRVDALSRQTISAGLPYEAVLADNRSTDETANVVESISRRSDATVVYVYESRQGTSFALNAGIDRARRPIIATTDDDGMPSPDRVELFDQADARVTVCESHQPQTHACADRRRLADGDRRGLAVRITIPLAVVGAPCHRINARRVGARNSRGRNPRGGARQQAQRLL